MTGEIDPNLGGWLWLVKWLLLIPHFIVLIFLWIAFIVVTIIAGFSILFTGRYPRGLFNFNVGVLRWTWRVSFYGYSALATDRYPPFSLSTRDYPANLEVAYPEQLSRGLVLVKWWLLAIPHYIVVTFLSGGAGFSAGLTSILALFGAIGHLFRGEYPSDIFEVVMGFNRWAFRVTAYAALMTDEYPPFRFNP
ncbi:MAG: DUF4389 domain-containing protein [SAR202 cluster bacterium]|nr:DUF4389 domain-containing protein [SAR202 cluster bacterium]